MAELIERYVHQVGRWLPRGERADIEAELRSQIQDRLDDRYPAAPSQAEVAAVLTELGDPSDIAASYNRDQYLIGPELYPYLMMTLRHVWLLVPAIVIFLNVFGALASSRQPDWPEWTFDTLWGIAQTTLIASALVVLVFAIVQRSNAGISADPTPFDPLTLPEVDDPHAVDRAEAFFGIVVGVIVTLILLYFLRAGGLTLRFDLNEPGEVIPVPAFWLALTIGATSGMIATHVVALRRGHWSTAALTITTALEVIGVFGLYFAVIQPGAERLFAANPSLADVPLIRRMPEFIMAASGLITLVNRGSQLIRIWGHTSDSPFDMTTRTQEE